MTHTSLAPQGVPVFLFRNGWWEHAITATPTTPVDPHVADLLVPQVMTGGLLGFESIRAVPVADWLEMTPVGGYLHIGDASVQSNTSVMFFRGLVYATTPTGQTALAPMVTAQVRRTYTGGLVDLVYVGEQLVAGQPEIKYVTSVPPVTQIYPVVAGAVVPMAFRLIQ